MGYFYLMIGIVAEVIGTSALKASESFTRFFPSAVVVIGYGLSFYFLSLALKTISVGIAYGIWSAVGIVLVSAIGYFAFKESLDIPAILGLGMIVLGVVVINVFSKTVSH